MDSDYFPFLYKPKTFDFAHISLVKTLVLQLRMFARKSSNIDFFYKTFVAARL